MAIRSVRIESGAIDASGDAVAVSDVIHGKILAVSVNYPAGACTVDIDTVGLADDIKIVDLASSNTDTTVYPRVPATDITGAAVTFDGTNEIYTPVPVSSRLQLTVAGGTEAQEVTVDVLYEV